MHAFSQTLTKITRSNMYVCMQKFMLENSSITEFGCQEAEEENNKSRKPWPSTYQ